MKDASVTLSLSLQEAAQIGLFTFLKDAGYEPAEVEKPDPVTGVKLIEAERQRQKNEEGYSLEHDRVEHADGELVDAAICYASAANKVPCELSWPWPGEDKRVKHPAKQDQINMLVKAGALIAAELDRLLNG